MQMMSKDNILRTFAPDTFSVICLDEAHHSGADSYQKIMNYFQPNFWLGMTASPETNRFDVYEIFDRNIAYEIRLQQALEEDLFSNESFAKSKFLFAFIIEEKHTV